VIGGGFLEGMRVLEKIIGYVCHSPRQITQAACTDDFLVSLSWGVPHEERA